MSVVVRSGRSDEGERLKQIAVDAKAFWGYERDRVVAWADGGDFTPERLRELVVFVADAEDGAVGWCSVIPKGGTAWLEDLWIDPGWIGKGIGRLLFQHAAAYASGLGAERLEWEAEPNAIGFYERMGATYLRDSELSEWGRTLSIMGVELRG
jgi:GNAT superfamily N-acetyltransferase